jgi:hypothetical protein
MVRLNSAIVTIALSACAYDASYGDCAVHCTADTGCPDGMTCRSQNLCRPSSATAACDGVPDSGVSSCTNLGDPIVDLALLKPTNADRIADSTHAASKANDGDASTSWNTGDATPGHWWLVNLGADHLLTSINTLWEYDDIHYYQYAVSISSDGTNFTTAIDETADTRTARARTDMFPAATCARFVRITKTDATGYWAILFTVNVMGK